MKVETVAVHAGRTVDPATGAVTLPIHLTTTFERDPDGSFPRGHLYSRNGNPTRDALERCLADLEGGAAAAAFASGTAAVTAIFQSLRPGDHVIVPTDLYYGIARGLRDNWVPWGLDVSFVDVTDPAEVERALRPSTRLVWVETPSNPLWRVTDIARIAAIAHAAGARCACDNTVAPIVQRPLELGADLVMYATTKYLGGHADVTGGALVTRADDESFQAIRRLQIFAGAVPSPFDCWLVLRGIQTLPWRMRAHSANAARLAAFLAEHPRVEAVHYPGLPSHRAHDVAARQMSGFSGMLSFQVRGGQGEAMAAAAKLRVFTRATSFGGTESLIEHRASIEGPETRTPVNLLRVSVGLEHVDDLIEDLDQALGR